MDWAYIFVIILAVLLAVFLVVAGVLVVMFVRVTRQIQHLTGSAHSTVRSLRRAADQVKSGAQVATLLGVIKKAIQRHKGSREKS